MDKLAQDRGILNKLREEINLSGKALERINPEFEEVMNKLRMSDERIRGFAEDLKSVVRNSASLYRRRDYLAAAKNIATFHERCRYIAAELNRFSKSVNMKHYKFLLDQFDDQQKQELFGYDPSKEIELEDYSSANDIAITASLQKSAGVVDWYHKMTDPIADLAHNLTNERGKAMKMFEKRFSVGFMKTLKQDTERMVQATIRFLSFLLVKFKRLATAVATRNVGAYKQNADDFVSKFAQYDTIFKNYHTKNIMPLKEQHEEYQRQAEEVAAAEKAKQYAAQQVKPNPNLQQELQSGPKPVPQTQTPAPTQQEKENVLNKLDEENEPFSLTNQMKKSHNEFIERMNILATKNDPKLLIKEILKYSAKIEDDNLADSLKLIAIAEGDWNEWEKKPEALKTAPKAPRPRTKKVETPQVPKVEPPPLR
jgi:hypothetical protein